MVNLIGILDTETNRNRIEFDGDVSKDKAMVMPLDGKLRDSTFRDMIGYMVHEVCDEEKQLAEEVGEYMRQHNGTSTICDIRACDSEGNYIAKNNSTIVGLDEKVEPYITRRTIDGDEFDCVEMIVGQITSVGKI